MPCFGEGQGPADKAQCKALHCSIPGPPCWPLDSADRWSSGEPWTGGPPSIPRTDGAVESLALLEAQHGAPNRGASMLPPRFGARRRSERPSSSPGPEWRAARCSGLGAGYSRPNHYSLAHCSLYPGARLHTRAHCQEHVVTPGTHCHTWAHTLPPWCKLSPLLTSRAHTVLHNQLAAHSLPSRLHTPQSLLRGSSPEVHTVTQRLSGCSVAAGR